MLLHHQRAFLYCKGSGATGGGLTVRFDAANLTDATSMWQRTVYVDRRTGPVDFFQDRDRRIGPIDVFTISGKF